MANGEWYYCLDHHTVEPYEACRSETRLGPYASPAEAAQALEKGADWNTVWENEPRFNDDPEPEDEDEETEGWGPFRH